MILFGEYKKLKNNMIVSDNENEDSMADFDTAAWLMVLTQKAQKGSELLFPYMTDKMNKEINKNMEMTNMLANVIGQPPAGKGRFTNTVAVKYYKEAPRTSGVGRTSRPDLFQAEQRNWLLAEWLHGTIQDSCLVYAACETSVECISGCR